VGLEKVLARKQHFARHSNTSPDMRLWLFSYAKRAMAPRDLLGGRLRGMIDAEVRLAAFERRLAQASDIEDCWAQLRAGTAEFGFQGVRMVIDGRVLEEPLSLNSGQLWQLRIPLQEGHYINFFREFGSHHLILSAFAISVGRGLSGWLAAQNHPEPLREPVAAQPHFTAAAGDRAAES
jgi:hypothetical protein